MSEIDVNLAFVNIDVRFGGCFNAKIGLVSRGRRTLSHLSHGDSQLSIRK